MRLFINVSDTPEKTNDRYRSKCQVEWVVDSNHKLMRSLNDRNFSYFSTLDRIYIDGHGSPSNPNAVYVSELCTQSTGYITASCLVIVLANLLKWSATNILPRIILHVCFSADCITPKGFINRGKLNVTRTGSLMDNIRQGINKIYEEEYELKGYIGQASRAEGGQESWCSTGKFNAMDCYRGFTGTSYKSRTQYLKYGSGRYEVLYLDAVHTALSRMYNQSQGAINCYINHIRDVLKWKPDLINVVVDSIKNKWPPKRLGEEIMQHKGLAAYIMDEGPADSITQNVYLKYGVDAETKRATRAVYMSRDGTCTQKTENGRETIPF